MSELDVVAALAAHWRDTVGLLSPDEVRALHDAAARLRAAAGDEAAARRAMADLMDVLAGALPRGHPVREAMTGSKRYGGGPVTDWAQVSAALGSIPDLGSLAAAPGGAAAAAGAAGARPEQAAAESAGPEGPAGWLLSAPALSEQEVRDSGGDPAAEGLIRLPAAGDRRLLPAFQFGSDGQPVPVVLTVNRLLDAEGDPWGVADWWLGRNAWLQGIPERLLGQVDDELLVLAARAELPDE